MAELKFSSLTPFPPVIERILYYLPWQLRIKLEGSCKQWKKILRPKLCPMPIDNKLTLWVVFTEELENSTMEICSWNCNTLRLKFAHFEQLLNALKRYASQIPLSTLHFMRFTPFQHELLDFIGEYFPRINQFCMSNCSLVGSGLTRVHWKTFYEKLPHLERIETLDVKTDSSLDDVLVDFLRTTNVKSVSVCQYPPTGPAKVTGETLKALSENPNRQKVRDIAFYNATQIMSEAVCDLVLSLAPLPSPIPRPAHLKPYEGRSPIPSQRKVNFYLCALDAQLLRLRLENKHGLQAVKEAKLESEPYGTGVFVATDNDIVQGFANSELFVRIV